MSLFLRVWPVVAWLSFGLWFLGLNLASSLPSTALPPVFHFPHADKFLHFVAFFAGASLLYLALRASPGKFFRNLPHALCAFALVGSFGILDEFRQLLTPSRSGADPLDMLANLIGAFAGAFATHYLYGRLVRLLPRS
jgi:VanZ family protein